MHCLRRGTGRWLRSGRAPLIAAFVSASFIRVLRTYRCGGRRRCGRSRLPGHGGGWCSGSGRWRRALRGHTRLWCWCNPRLRHDRRCGTRRYGCAAGRRRTGHWRRRGARNTGRCNAASFAALARAQRHRFRRFRAHDSNVCGRCGCRRSDRNGSAFQSTAWVFLLRVHPLRSGRQWSHRRRRLAHDRGSPQHVNGRFLRGRRCPARHAHRRWRNRRERRHHLRA